MSFVPESPGAGRTPDSRPTDLSAFARRRARASDPSRGRTDPTNNLPNLASAFVGRAAEVAQVTALLADSRLVTLTGPGGIGKTRLALEVASQSLRNYEGGVWFVELGPLVHPSDLPGAVFGVVPGGDHRADAPSTDDLAALMSGRPMLLVLDNCEHLVAACAHLVERLLRACPDLDVLATSRETLGISGEHNWKVGPLSVRDPDGVVVGSPAMSEAGELFLRRAAESNPRFELTAATTPTVAEICRRLDGIPLAIELAAARVSALAPADILRRVDDRFRLLKTASPTVPTRQQTLSATLEWGHDLLTPAEAALLRRLSVFEGWTVAAAEEVCAGGPVRRADVVDHVAALVRKSLVDVDETDGSARYHQLETIRLWAGAKLRGSESTAVRRRHALWYLRLAEESDEDLAHRHRTARLEDFDLEHDNLRAALNWAQDAGEVEIALRLITAMARFWRLRGHIDEGQRWMEWAVVACAEAPLPLRAKALRAAGLLRGLLGDFTSALPLLEQSSDFYAESGDHEASLCACNPAFLMSRNPRHALAKLQERAAFCRRTGDTRGLAHLLYSIGHVHYVLGAPDEARRHFEESVQLGRGAADGEALRSGLFGLARVDLLLGDLIGAEGWAAEARLSAESSEDAVDVSDALTYLGEVALARGRWDKARSLFIESDRLARLGGMPLSVACSLSSLARLALSVGDREAGALFEQSLSVADAGEIPVFHEIRCRVGLGSAAERQGDLSAAAGHLFEAVEMAQAIGDVVPLADALCRLSLVVRRQGNDDEAMALAHRALDLHHRVGAIPGIASCLDALAGLAVDGRPETAARLFAAAEAMREPQGHARSRPDQARYDVDLTQLRARMDSEVLAAIWAEGGALSIEAAVAYAQRGRRSTERPTKGWDSLTFAEREVVRLVAQGLTNPEVGRRLFISPRTVGTHLTHVFDKLGVRSRGALIQKLGDREV